MSNGDVPQTTALDNDMVLAREKALKTKELKRTVRRIILYLIFVCILLGASYSNHDLKSFNFQKTLRQNYFDEINTQFADVKSLFIYFF